MLRVVLLHGPPGTGKTSLCKALAQKLSIRLSERYSQCRLLEINSHSLFSKWFSESGKLVQKLFLSISELADDDEVFLVILIDEVESLTAARAGAIAGQEPSDALRVVNALLTQLDRMKQKKNVLFLATSNLVGAIDPAFKDRADIVRYIGLPPTEAIYDMLHSCLMELMAKGLVQRLPVPNRRISDTPNRAAMAGIREWDVSSSLWTLSARCKGFSGRALRRLPVLAHARAIARGASASISGTNKTQPSSTLNSPHSTRGSAVPQENGWVKANGTPDQNSMQAFRMNRSRIRTAEQWIKDMEAVIEQSRAQSELLQ
ncbi:hypothetical protein FRC17_004030 [Serendipita sp. 399]|nr:hypothetical protein FRC17_004030 [Serendipita sp. 399]